MTSGALRVMSYNVHMLRDDGGALREVLRREAPDVVALQEPPRGPLGRGRLRRLAEDTGLVPVVSGGGARTTALLVRTGLPAHGRRAMRLPWRVGRTRRGLAMAEVAGVRVLSVHLGLDAAERARHVTRILPVVAAAPGSCLVAGDLNEGPDGPSSRRLRLHLRDLAAAAGPTHPASAPRARIDVVLGSPGLRAVSARTVDDDVARRASDHLPVVVEVRW